MKRCIRCLLLASICICIWGCSEESSKDDAASKADGISEDSGGTGDSSKDTGTTDQNPEEAGKPENTDNPEAGNPEEKPSEPVDPDPGQPDPDPGQPDPDPGQLDPDPGQPVPDPGQPDPDPGQLDPDPGQTDPDPGQTDPDPGQTDPDPGQTDPDPGTCTGLMCDGVCVDIRTNNSHCGGCGFACGAGLHCEAMECACDDSALTKCGYNNCVNLMTDPNHCGKCNNVCSSGKCTNGSCTGGTTQQPSAGQHVVDYARQFLYSATHLCTNDLRLTGKLTTLIDIANGGASYNYSYDNNCANFVSSVLIDTGELTANDFLSAPVWKYRESVEAIKDVCDRKVNGYHVVTDPHQAQAGDIWYRLAYDAQGKKIYSHTELIVKVEGDNWWQIGSNEFRADEKVGCLNNHDTDPKYSSNPLDYQRVEEHIRPMSDGGVVCSRR